MELRPFYDQSEIVNESIKSVRDAILLGLVLASLIMVLFLRDWGTSLVAGLVIPATIAVTFIALRVLGQSFNLMTLGGLAAAVGLVIDDAIVVVENIVMHRDSGPVARRSHPQRDSRNPRSAGRVHHHAHRGLPAADLDHRRDWRVLPRPGGHGGHGAAHLAGAGAHLDPHAEPLLHSQPLRARAAAEHHSVSAVALLHAYERVLRFTLEHKLVLAAVLAAADRRVVSLLQQHRHATCCPRWTKAASSWTTSCPPALRWRRPTA